MIRDATLPLDSYRLAQMLSQVPCFICNTSNTSESEVCHYCAAPLALAHQAATQKTAPRMVAVIGPSGAGKTVYLGMLLDMLSRQTEPLQILARGAFSITLQQTTMAALSRCEFPAKTPNEPDRWNWVHCQIQAAKQRRPLELIMPDMAGESLLEEVEHPHSYPVVRALLRKSAGVLVLIDASRLQDGTLECDYFSMKLLTYLAELEADRKQGWPNRPVGLVLSKADECEECFKDPGNFARQRSPGLWQLCQERFRRTRFFAAGVAGSCAYRQGYGSGRVRVPLRIEPRGILEPFTWLISELRR